MLLRGWLRDSGYPICYDLLLFTTVRRYSHYLRLLALFVLFAIHYLGLFAVRYSRVFAIRVLQIPGEVLLNQNLSTHISTDYRPIVGQLSTDYRSAHQHICWVLTLLLMDGIAQVSICFLSMLTKLSDFDGKSLTLFPWISGRQRSRKCLTSFTLACSYIHSLRIDIPF